jgi:Uma2 family endonuclease
MCSIPASRFSIFLRYIGASRCGGADRAMEALTIDFSTARLTDDQFYYLCRQNEALCFEMTAQGEVIVMSPVGGDSGEREADFITDLKIWNRASRLGHVFSSSTMFRLPNGAKRSPDAAWVETNRWNALTPVERQKFPPIAPDFVIELRSATDSLKVLQEKMQEYIDQGVKLGWLLNPQDQQAEIYAPGQAVVTVALPTTLSGGALMPGFSLVVPLF